MEQIESRNLAAPSLMQLMRGFGRKRIMSALAALNFLSCTDLDNLGSNDDSLNNTDTSSFDASEQDSIQNPEGEPQACDLQPDPIRKHIDLNKESLIGICQQCHTEGGIGQPAWAYYGDKDPMKLQKSVDRIGELCEEHTADGDPLLLAVPQLKALDSKGHPHSPGAIDVGIALDLAIRNLCASTAGFIELKGESPLVNTDCEESERLIENNFEGVEMLNNEQLLEKFYSVFAIRRLVPAPDVSTNVRLEGVLRKLTQTTEFYEALRVHLNNKLLNIRKLKGTDEVKKLTEDEYALNLDGVDDDEAVDIVLNQLVWVVMNDLDFREFVTGEELILPGEKPKDAGPHEAWEQRLHPQEIHNVPISGPLTNPAFYLANPTTATDVQRRNANIFAKLFLGRNVKKEFKLVPRDQMVGGDPNINQNAANPDCAGCHYGPIDPMANGLSQMYEGRFSLVTPQFVLNRFVYAGLDGRNIPPTAPDKIRQEAALIADNPQYAFGAANFSFELVFQRERYFRPLSTDIDNYAAKTRRAVYDEDYIKNKAETFTDTGRNFREMVIQMAMSDDFRAGNKIKGELTAERAIELEGVGTGFITPENFNGGMENFMGSQIYENGIAEEILEAGVEDLGGLSKTTTVRRPGANGASEIRLQSIAFNARKVVEEDFKLPQDQRKWFSYIDENQGPIVVSNGNPIGDNPENYKITLTILLNKAFSLDEEGNPYTPNNPEVLEYYEHVLELYKAFDNNPGKFDQPTRIRKLWEVVLIEMIQSPRSTSK
ncbi:MAG: hypothetical protein AAB373_00910 [Patescibacteria group bacterium]